MTIEAGARASGHLARRLLDGHSRLMDLILDLELLALGAMATLVGLLSVALMDHDGRFRLRRRMQLRLHRG